MENKSALDYLNTPYENKEQKAIEITQTKKDDAVSDLIDIIYFEFPKQTYLYDQIYCIKALPLTRSERALRFLECLLYFRRGDSKTRKWGIVTENEIATYEYNLSISYRELFFYNTRGPLNKSLNTIQDIYSYDNGLYPFAQHINLGIQWNDTAKIIQRAVKVLEVLFGEWGKYMTI